jgi:hypothetical protein
MDNPLIFLDEIQSFTNTSSTPLNTQIDTLRSATNPTATPLSTQIANLDTKVGNITNAVSGISPVKQSFMIQVGYNPTGSTNIQEITFGGKSINVNKSLVILNVNLTFAGTIGGTNTVLVYPCYVYNITSTSVQIKASRYSNTFGNTFNSSTLLSGSIQVIEYN